MDARTKCRRVALCLLVFNGVTASLGASGLIQGPSGEHVGMALDLLEATPFADYFWPGVILLVANGLLSLLVAWLTWRRVRGHPTWIMLQGVVLVGWLGAEVAWGIYFVPLQTLYLLVALALIWCGSRLRAHA